MSMIEQAIADHAGWETTEPLHLALTLSLYRQNSGWSSGRHFWLTEKDCTSWQPGGCSSVMVLGEPIEKPGDRTSISAWHYRN